MGAGIGKTRRVKSSKGNSVRKKFISKNPQGGTGVIPPHWLKAIPNVSASLPKSWNLFYWENNDVSQEKKVPKNSRIGLMLGRSVAKSNDFLEKEWDEINKSGAEKRDLREEVRKKETAARKQQEKARQDDKDFKDHKKEISGPIKW